MEASLQIPVLEAIYAMRKNGLLIPPSQQTTYNNLHAFYLEKISYPHVIDPLGMLLMIFGINPSGQFNTLNDNGFATMLTKFYSLAKQSTTHDQFLHRARALAMKVMGDDSIIRDHPLITHYPVDSLDLGFLLTIEAAKSTILKASFLSNGWTLVTKYGILIPRGNFDKLIASVYYNMPKHSWRLVYVKLHSLRTLTYAYPEIDYRVKSYIAYINQHHYQDMIEETFMDSVISFNSVISQSKTDTELEFLILGITPETNFRLPA